MSKSIQAIRGMNDILPNETPCWAFIESICRNIAKQYAYHEIRFPIVEQTALFKRAVGEVTDIVEKEMYTFEDRNGDSLSLRPEGTACTVRAALQHSLIHRQVQRLWYMGPMFRHERPQKGRYRQFHQFSVEALGMADPAVDAEVILLSKRLLSDLGLLDGLTLQINSLGTAESRQAYRQVLVDYYRQHFDDLDEDSQRRLDKNPLRILDSKNPDMKAININAPKLADSYDDISLAHFNRLCALLTASGVNFTVNQALVRGLDYYSHTVFEWVTDSLGAQGTVCAGGRYDGLVEQLGGPSTPAFGFSMGLERIALLLKQQKEFEQTPDVYFVLMGDKAVETGLKLAEDMHDQLPAISIEINCTGGSFKSQFKKADKSGARFALVIGEDEVAKGEFGLKQLREEGEQQMLNTSDLLAYLGEI